MGVWSPWERDKVRQDLLGFISLGPTAEGRGLLHEPQHHVSPGPGGSARPCTAQNPLGCGGEAAALSPGPREAVIPLSSCSNSSRDTSQNRHI